MLDMLDTFFGKCQRPVFSLGVSQRTIGGYIPYPYAYYLIYLWKFELKWHAHLPWSLKLQKNTGRKNTLVTSCVLFQMLQLNSRPQLKYFSEKLLLSQKLCYLQREPFLTRHNVLSYYQHDQQLSIARYQVISFYSNNYFKYLQPIQ